MHTFPPLYSRGGVNVHDSAGYTPLYHCILGAGVNMHDSAGYTPLHHCILGAGVNVHDSAGYTPLHHCLTSVGNNATLQMARILLKKVIDSQK